MKRISTKSAAVIALVVLAITGLVWWNLLQGQAAERLETAIVNVQNGLTAEEVDRFVGMAPDRVEIQNGFLKYGGALFMAGGNQEENGAELHTIRIWKRGSVTATVILDQSGHVVGRSVWRPQRRGRTSYFGWLGLPF